MADAEQILELTHAVDSVAREKILAIKKVTSTTRILSLNALIEATRAGELGRGFAVVANEVKNVSDDISKITQSLERELAGTIRDLTEVGESLIQQLRGSRLTDLALNMIEIIDRNLYERSCDVRWWATDSAVVDCLGRDDAAAFASKRLAVILDSYTVYLDLWIVDTNGRVRASGRPDRYPRVVNSDVSQQAWFRDAMNTRDGTDYAVADVAANPALNNALVATYSTAIREGGDVNGKILGVLGVFFDWQPQAQTIVKNVRLTKAEAAFTRCLLVDQNHRVIAASNDTGILTEILPLSTSGRDQGDYVDDAGRTIGYALTPGYETYKGLGWYGVVIQTPST
ncbi:methyl-accepting chemotaxis protein [Telmatospirillum siberiense]|uniref:Chemotaxis protein n=1 Tax=Telmatospirillum siberiense TaxID=382514 RepID=A0A2N3Q1V1_9PROT|nr:methyl-accepting chemotaxis protein [Telmatospirillum siberiense]PKU26629.1 chemotaxis protein [Telmatospirillum siberiense]